jgi:hypothetical protein
VPSGPDDSRHPGAVGLVAAAFVLIAAGCTGSPEISASATDAPAPSSPAATASSASSPSPTATPEPTPLVALPDPAHPFTADELLTAMRESRRPGGVPDTLETPAIAAAVAERLWTFGPGGWATSSVGGGCGPQVCSLEVGGTAEGALGEDLYVFTIDPASGAVSLMDASLGGTPAELVEALDAAARETWEGSLQGLGLASIAWQPPPDEGTFILTYRSGGEEGSPGVTLLLDVIEGTAEAR